MWDGLKRALRSRQLSFTSLEKEVTLTGAVSLDPEPIPLDIKIILFGDYRTYQLLQHYDPEFGELFRVTADFEDEMKRTPDSELQYARFISSVVNDNNMLHCDKKPLRALSSTAHACLVTKPSFRCILPTSLTYYVSLTTSLAKRIPT